jgi:hypothetical protein
MFWYISLLIINLLEHLPSIFPTHAAHAGRFKTLEILGPVPLPLYMISIKFSSLNASLQCLSTRPKPFCYLYLLH